MCMGNVTVCPEPRERSRSALLGLLYTEAESIQSNSLVSILCHWTHQTPWEKRKFDFRVGLTDIHAHGLCGSVSRASRTQSLSSTRFIIQ